MFNDIDWKGALRRAALTVLIYLGLVYVLDVAFPGSAGGIVPLAINAVILFVVFTFFHAFVERRKRRQRAALQPQGKAKARRPADASEEDGEGEIPASELKGRQNPNTSRRKASRRRR
ncbi:hypothetical protein GBA65_14270 [Rubrobacter marinus]|uniref:Uncharacterized protein n=1 Tax=Rubrobacter marinus TaxID=2653852 RepID=A0A6G8PZ90_9ACTN|nr:hypothetical protein [Rubrobacter marinus]QIN79488.1 hypothetical protein GBA65_14270 [Rubrobacter marinus]